MLQQHGQVEGGDLSKSLGDVEEIPVPDIVATQIVKATDRSQPAGHFLETLLRGMIEAIAVVAVGER